jgi:hypothetical protein
MSEGTKGNLFVNKLDDLLEEYSQRRKLENTGGDIYMSSQTDEPRDIDLNCRFKENCNTLRYNSGACPCGLEEG